MAVIYDTEEKSLGIKKEDNLLQLCLTHKIPISHSCEGMASCGTCRIIVTDGLENFPPRNELESEMAEDRKFDSNERLACQTELPLSFRFKLPED